MVTVQGEVVEALYEALRASGVAETDALRLAPAPEGFHLEVDEPTNEDRIIWFQDAPVLLIEPAVEEHLADAVIELADGDDSEGLKLVIRTDSSG